MSNSSSVPKLWLDTGLLIIFGSSIDAQEHSHNAIQIIWPMGHQSLLLNGAEYDSACIIAAGQAHSLTLELGWIILIEPQSKLGELINRGLAGSSFKRLDVTNQVQVSLGQEADITTVLAALQPIWESLNLHLSDFIHTHKYANMDSRIAQLQAHLNHCFDGECLKPEAWKAESIAQDLALSESRFLHLFKQEMSIPWRPYLLWRRLLCAVNSMQKGRSATEAAHIAGFSDSAHLSRTFKKMFGLSIRQASKR